MRCTRKELKATIRELSSQVTRLNAAVRNRPPVFVVDSEMLRGCRVIVTRVDVDYDEISTGFGSPPLRGLASMVLQVTGPAPDDFGLGYYWLVPENGVSK